MTLWKLMGLGAFGSLHRSGGARVASYALLAYLARAAWRITSSIRAAKSAEFHTTSG